MELENNSQVESSENLPVIQEEHSSRIPKFNQGMFLPLSILIAAVLISGTVLFAKFYSSTPSVAKSKPVMVNLKLTSDDHVMGDANAKVTVIEFADFRCPFCERFFQDAEKNIIKNYVDVGKVRFVFKNYAFLGQQSTWASEASECAAEQGKFWEYHNWLYNNQADESNLAYYSKANLIKYGSKVGVNVQQFASCVNTDKYAQRITDGLNQGQGIGVNGTPTILIVKGNNFTFDSAYIKDHSSDNVIKLPNGNYFIVGAQPFAVFQTAIDSLVK